MQGGHVFYRIDRARALGALFRVAFVVALVLGTHLATTDAPPHAMASLNDKLQHLTAFAVLALLLDRSYFRQRAYWSAVALPLLGYGLAIECVQYFLPYRSFDLLDLVADAIGLGAYCLLRPLVGAIPLLRRPAAS